MKVVHVWTKNNHITEIFRTFKDCFVKNSLQNLAFLLFFLCFLRKLLLRVNFLQKISYHMHCHNEKFSNKAFLNGFRWKKFLQPTELICLNFPIFVIAGAWEIEIWSEYREMLKSEFFIFATMEKIKNWQNICWNFKQTGKFCEIVKV